MSIRQRSRIDAKLNKALTTYAAAAGAAAVGLIASASPAEAKVIYTPTYANLTSSYYFDYYLDLNHDGTTDFILWNVASCSSGGCGGELMAYLSGGPNVVVGAPWKASALPAGAVIGPAAQFNANSRMIIAEGGFEIQNSHDEPVGWYGQFANGGKGVRDRYLGLKFVIRGETHYGWARISVSIPNPKVLNFTAILTGYAYETEPNKAITAGEETGADSNLGSGALKLKLDQPLNLGMLACGADGLAIWRREENLAS